MGLNIYFVRVSTLHSSGSPPDIHRLGLNPGFIWASTHNSSRVSTLYSSGLNPSLIWASTQYLGINPIFVKGLHPVIVRASTRHSSGHQPSVWASTHYSSGSLPVTRQFGWASTQRSSWSINPFVAFVKSSSWSLSSSKSAPRLVVGECWKSTRSVFVPCHHLLDAGFHHRCFSPSSRNFGLPLLSSRCLAVGEC